MLVSWTPWISFWRSPGDKIAIKYHYLTVWCDRPLHGDFRTELFLLSFPFFCALISEILKENNWVLTWNNAECFGCNVSLYKLVKDTEHLLEGNLKGHTLCIGSLSWSPKPCCYFECLQ